MQRRDPRSIARAALLIAIGIGVLGEIALDGPAPGINVVIMTVVVLSAAWLVRRPGRAPDRVDAWLPVTAVILATFVAIRADPFLMFLDLAGAAAFTGASVAAFSGLAVTRRSTSVIVVMGVWIIGSAMAGMAQLIDAARPLRRDVPWSRPAWLGSVGRGLLLAIPLMTIFAVLFASADPIFDRVVGDLIGFEIDLGDLPGRVLFVAAVAWFAGGLLAVAARGVPPVEAASLGAAAPPPALTLSRSLGTTEALVVLIAVDAVVGLFVGLQLAYLFGGLDTLAAAGMTYSSYARRGYFELVAAAALAGGILVALEYQIMVRTRLYVALAIGLVGLTMVVLASAVVRLQLYQHAYGWTELRLYVAVSILAMAVSLAALAVLLATDRTRWLGHAMAVIGVVALIGLNAIAPAAFVAERNVQRVIDPSLVPIDGEARLDADYLAVLPDDAIPVLAAAVPRLPEPDARRITRLLADRHAELAAQPAYQGPLAWYLGRQRARDALAALP